MPGGGVSGRDGAPELKHSWNRLCLSKPSQGRDLLTGDHVPQSRRLRQPHQPKAVVLGGAAALDIKFGQMVHGVRVSLISGQSQPMQAEIRFVCVEKQQRQIRLRLRVTGSGLYGANSRNGRNRTLRPLATNVNYF